MGLPERGWRKLVHIARLGTEKDDHIGGRLRAQFQVHQAAEDPVTLGVLEHVVIHQPEFDAVQGLRHPAQRTGSEGVLAEQGLLLIQVEDHRRTERAGTRSSSEESRPTRHAIVGAQPSGAAIAALGSAAR